MCSRNLGPLVMPRVPGELSSHARNMRPAELASVRALMQLQATSHLELQYHDLMDLLGVAGSQAELWNAWKGIASTWRSSFISTLPPSSTTTCNIALQKHESTHLQFHGRPLVFLRSLSQCLCYLACSTTALQFCEEITILPFQKGRRSSVLSQRTRQDHNACFF